MQLVVLDGFALNPADLSWDALRAFGNLSIYDRTPRECVAERIGKAEIIFTNKTPITRETLLACPSVRYVGVLATGYNIVDVAAAKELGVAVTNVPGYSTHAVAQFVFALLLEICHHVGAHHEAVQRGKWFRSADYCFWDYPLIELAGKTMGIVGYGSIGRQTAAVALALGMNVLVYTRTPDATEQTDRLRFDSLDEVLRGADVLSLHCPLTDQTQGLIDKAALAKMKHGAILINTARGQLLVESDVRDALQSGKLSAAGVDVVSAEPIAEGNPLLGAKNCFITPHIAWAPLEARARLMEIAASNLRAFLNGESVNRVE